MLNKYIMLFSWDEHECDVDLRRSCLCGRLVLHPVQGYWPIQHVDEQEAQYVASSIYQKLLFIVPEIHFCENTRKQFKWKGLFKNDRFSR